MRHLGFFCIFVGFDPSWDVCVLSVGGRFCGSEDRFSTLDCSNSTSSYIRPTTVYFAKSDPNPEVEVYGVVIAADCGCSVVYVTVRLCFFGHKGTLLDGVV